MAVGRHRDPQPHTHQRALGHADDGLSRFVVLVPPLDLNPLLIGRDGALTRDFVHRDVEEKGRAARRRGIRGPNVEDNALPASRSIRDCSRERARYLAHGVATRAEHDLIPGPNLVAPLCRASLPSSEIGQGGGRCPEVLRIPIPPAPGASRLLDQRFDEGTYQRVGRIDNQGCRQESRHRPLTRGEVEPVTAPRGVRQHGPATFHPHRRPDR